MSHINFDEITLGAAGVEEARAALRQLLRTPSHASARQAYAILRSWVWKALDSRRRDPELRDWHALMKAVAGALHPDFPSESERIETLADLIHESVAVAAVYAPAEIARRQHVKDILYIAHRQEDLRIARAELLERLGLRQANLSRILNMMVLATMFRRVQVGKEAYFELTPLGVEQASLVARSDLSQRVYRSFDRPSLRTLLTAITERTKQDDYSAPQTRRPTEFVRRHKPRVEPAEPAGLGGADALQALRLNRHGDRREHGEVELAS